MLVMTAKLEKGKLLALGVAVVALILGLWFVFGGSADTPTMAASDAADTNDARVQFLAGHGWQVNASPRESMQVRIPKDSTEVFDRYNELQKSQGYDLSQYAGKTLMRYVYQVTNYPGATEPVYATVLVYRDQVVGGDITDTSPGGKVQPFGASQAPTTPSSPTE